MTSQIESTGRPVFDGGRVVDDALSVLRAHALPVLGSAVLLRLIPGMAGAWLASPTLSPLGSSLWYQYGFPLLESAISVFWAAWLTRLAVTHLRGETGQAPLDHIQPIVDRLGPIYATKIVTYIGVALASILLVVPGIILSVRWAVAMPAVVMERADAQTAIARSGKLTEGSRMAIFGLGLIFAIASLICAVLLASTVGGGFSALGLGTGPPVYVIVAQPALASLLAIISTLGVAAIYAQLRRLKTGSEAEIAAEVFS